MNKQLMEFYCPTDEKHDIKDYGKSNDNWIVYLGKCPVCNKQPKFRTKPPIKKEGKNK